jgi:2-amino-4-hydroxy-6-hydroxymethyldihydropteridine diphosphokinase
MNHFFLLMGSNFHAARNLELAREQLEELFPKELVFSDPLKSEAVDANGVPFPDAKHYLNMLCFGRSEWALDRIQSSLKLLENRSGRVRGVEAKGQVTLDLDLVEWNDGVLRPKDACQNYYIACKINLGSKLKG